MHGDTFYSDTAKGTHNTVNAISTNLDEYPGTKINEAVFYFAPLPTTFTSGAFPMAQYIPRMNSTMEYLNVTVDEFPAECNNDLKMGFYASYQWGHESQLQPIRFEACMTGDLTTSPFHPTFDRQDITEILYLKRYIYADDSFTAYKITATTSLGYFEVPSMHNGHRAGPLMTKFPKSANDTIAIGKIPYISKRENNGTLLSNITTAANRNHGPLALLTVSLFGEGSFLDRHFKDPEGLALERPTIEDEDGWTTDIRSPTCVSLPPLAGISSWELTGCLTDYSYKAAPGTFRRIDEWLSSFDFTANARKTLSIALFYAHKTWLGGKGGGYSIYSPAKFERRIHYADGIPTFKSSLSTREILAGSALLGLHLLGLLVLAAYTWYLKPWVPWLGSEVMIRSGTAFADTLSAAQDQKEWEHTVQACPGFIGDDRPGETTGNMSFGAKASLGTGFGKRFTRSFA